jgi:uncharacterized protein with PIN domain
MSYWDTSTLVKLYAQEADSAIFEAHVVSDPGQPVTSEITLYEARATFRRKEADGAIAAGAAQQLYEELLRNIAAGELGLIKLGADVEREYGVVLNLCCQPSTSILPNCSDSPCSRPDVPRRC